MWNKQEDGIWRWPREFLRLGIGKARTGSDCELGESHREFAHSAEVKVKHCEDENTHLSFSFSEFKARS